MFIPVRLPPVVVAAILKALELGTSRPELRKRLWENAEYFHKQLTGLGIDTGKSTTYIMPLVIGDRERMYRIGHELRSAGTLGCASRLSGGAAGSYLFPGLRYGQSYSGRSRRSTQYSFRCFDPGADASRRIWSIRNHMAQQRYVSSKNETVRMFESDFMEFFSHVHPITPLVIYLPVIGLMLYLAIGPRALSVAVCALLFLLGIFIWTLVEYSMHRFVFHYEPKKRLGEEIAFPATRRSP